MSYQLWVMSRIAKGGERKEIEWYNYLGAMNEIQRIGQIVGGKWVPNHKGKGFHKILWKTWLGKIDSG